MKVYHKKYISQPFLVAVFYGNAKPQHVECLLNDIVEEIKDLVRNGVQLYERDYSFKVLTLIADGQARAYLKCIKGPTGFFSCERCEIEGQTVNRRRVFSELHCKKRTKLSFKTKDQEQHHHPNLTTPLIHIPNFDPVKDVVLDSMHLLYLGVMKNLLERWILKGSIYRLHQSNRKVLRDLMESIEQFIPVEFQRRKFDAEDVSHWKATQFRCILIYIVPIILKFVLPTDLYKHFLLLHVASRILCHSELAISRVDDAKKWLRRFFKKTSQFYGDDSQTLNFHNLIHLADDVRHLKAPLNDYSAFWGENYIGKLKNLVHSTAKALQQIINRLNAVELSDDVKIKEDCPLGKYIFERTEPEFFNFDGEKKMIRIKSFELKGMLYSSCPPNNVVELRSRTIFQINMILLNVHNRHQSSFQGQRMKDFYIRGYRHLDHEDVFTSPCLSSEVGIIKITKFSKTAELMKVKYIRSKCMLLQLEETNYSISLLHSEIA